MTISDWIMIPSVLLAPFFAVCAQNKINELKEKRKYKLWVFRTLMSTRANKISPEHVQALNSIELLFSKKSSENEVLKKWNEYRDHLNDGPKPTPEELENDKDYWIRKIEEWENKSDYLFVELLNLMGKALGYDFDKVTLKKGIYYPIGQGNIVSNNLLIQRELANILSGKSELPVKIIGYVNRDT